MHTRVTDAGLVQLAAMSQLRKLRFDGTTVTDAGLAALDGLSLRSLSIGQTAITDAGLVHLESHQ